MIWMGRVPNQKHIVVSKAPCDVAHIYTMRNKESEAYASRTLGNAAYRMWTYLSGHQDGYGFDLSSAAVEKEYGIKIRQYNTGVAELIEKGFLKLLDDNNNYSFVEYPVITKCNNETCDTGATSLVYTSRDDKVGSILSKEEERKIYTTDGDTFNLPIENILSGLKLVLKNKQNEGVIREIREKCDLTEKQKKEIDDTLDFWELDF